MIRMGIFLTTLFFLSLLLLSLYYPTVDYISVRGAKHYDAQALAQVANLYEGRPLLWIRQRDVRSIVNAPWTEKARLVRHFPNSVSLMVWERTPVAVYYPTNYEYTGASPVGYTLAGEVLPDIRPNEIAGLTKIEGWGTERIDEALDLLRLLHIERPLVINYTPQGFDIRLADASVYTPDIQHLQTHWQAFQNALTQIRLQQAQDSTYVGSASLRAPRHRIAIYAWGISSGIFSDSAGNAQGILRSIVERIPKDSMPRSVSFNQCEDNQTMEEGTLYHFSNVLQASYSRVVRHYKPYWSAAVLDEITQHTYKNIARSVGV